MTTISLTCCFITDVSKHSHLKHHVIIFIDIITLARGLSQLQSGVSELVWSVLEGFSCLSAFLKEDVNKAELSFSHFSRYLRASPKRQPASLHKCSELQKKERKQKMTIFLKVSPITGSLSFSLHSNNESHKPAVPLRGMRINKYIATFNLP